MRSAAERRPGWPGSLASGASRQHGIRYGDLQVTITLENEQIASVRALVASGKARNVSSFVKHAVAVSLADVAGWADVLAEAVEQTGGPLTRRERAWADSVLRPRGKRRKRAAA